MTGTQQAIFTLGTALPVWCWILSTAARRLSHRLRALEEARIKADGLLWDRLNAQRGDIEMLKKDMYGDDRQK